MADPLDAAAAVTESANDNNDDNVEDLYADLDEQVAAALAAAGESGGSNARVSDPLTDGEVEVPNADANEALDLGDGTDGYSSSDEESDDGLRIVLNEDTSAPLPPPPVGRGEGCVDEGEDGDDSGSRVKGSSDDGGWAAIGLQCKGLLEKTALPIMGQVDRGHQHVFQRDYNISLPRNSTIFDIDIEAFQQKPWRQQGVDLTDYFNFSLDEEGWRKYWSSMKQLRSGARSLANEKLGLDQESYKLKYVKAMPKVANDSGSEGRNVLAKPKGRAIHVEGSARERVPSADLWRPIQRDSDVVIQVNMTLSPSNQSTSDDSSKLNHKRADAERVVDKEVHDGGSSECIGSKLDTRDSYFARDQSPSPDYSDMLSGESEDLYFKRANRYPDSRDSFEDIKLQDECVKTDFYCHSSKSARENSESCSRSYTPSAVDRNKMASKLLWRGEAPFAGREGDLFLDRNSDRDLLKSGHKARKEHRRQSLDDGRNAIFVEKEKLTNSNPSRYYRKYEKRRSSSSSLRINYHNSVCNRSYEKQRYSPLERIALKQNERGFSCESNYHHRQSLSCGINEGEDFDEWFSSAKEWQQDRGHLYHSMVKADMPDADDGRMYRGRYSQEKRRARHEHSVDVEFSHYTDYRFGKWQSPEVRGRRREGKFAKSNDGHFRHANHLELYPSLSNSERDQPATGFPFLSSINRCIDIKKIRNAKMVQNHCYGHHQKNKQHDSSFRIGNIPRSALRTEAFAETGRFILPVKRKLHSEQAVLLKQAVSMDQKTLADLSLLKGRRLMHGQSIVGDRRIYALKLHKSTEETNTEAICSSSDLRNRNTVSNICVGRRHELDSAYNNHLDDRKIKFERRGNELRRVIENDQNGRHPVDEDLRGSRYMHAHQNLRKQNTGCFRSGNQELEKSADQNWLNEDVEIEEGELIEEDHRHDIISKSNPKPRNVVLKSIIETSSAELFQVNSAVSNRAACNNRATRECDDKQILEVMEKMQKRRERFKEAIAPKKEDADKEKLSALACSTDHIQNQRPARKRRWGGNSWMLEMS